MEITNFFITSIASLGMQKNDNFLLKLITEMFLACMYNIIEYFGFIINDIFFVVAEINQTNEITAITVFTSLLGISLMVIMVGKQLLGTYALETEGDADRDPINILYKVGKAVAIIGCNSWIFTELLKFSNSLGRDINKVINGSTEVVNIIKAMLIDAENSPAYVLCVASLIIGIILFVFQAGRRGAELSMSRILLPIFATDIINSNPEKWNMFFFQYVINFVGYIIQMVCFRLMILFMSYLRAYSDVTELMKYFIVTMGWLTMAIKVPQWLEKYVYISGTGRTISSGASRLSQVIIYSKVRK